MAKKETKKNTKKQKKGQANASPDSAAQNTQGQNGAQNPAADMAVNINNTKLDRNAVTADQMTQAQIEEAIKESQNPTSRLKKLRSPLSVRGCLLNILILVVLTVAIVLLCCYIMLDKETFNLWVVIKDMSDKFGITQFFGKVAAWFKGIFSKG